MRSSERLAGKSWATSVPVGVVMTLLLGLIGVSGLWLGATGEEDRLFRLVMGTFMLSIAVMAGLGLRRSVTRWRVGELDGRPAWVMRAMEAGQVPAAAVALTSLGVGAVLAVLVDPDAGRIIVATPFAVVLPVLALELWVTVLRKPELRLSADRIELHGAGIDTELRWDDVQGVIFANVGTRWGAIVVTPKPGAPSYGYRLRRRVILPLDRVPDPPGVHVRFGLVPDIHQLVQILCDMHAGGRPMREAMLSRGHPRDLGY